MRGCLCLCLTITSQTFRILVLSQFVNAETSIQLCVLEIRAGGVPSCVVFVLKEQSAQNWYSNGNTDFSIAIPQHPKWEEHRRVSLIY